MINTIEDFAAWVDAYTFVDAETLKLDLDALELDAGLYINLDSEVYFNDSDPAAITVAIHDLDTDGAGLSVLHSYIIS